MEKKILFELHMHTRHSDGKNTTFEMADASVAQNIQIGLSDHGPAHLYFGAKNADMEQLFQEIQLYQNTHPSRKILYGIEANFIGHGKIDADQLERSFDYVLAGYHKGIFPRRLLSPFLSLQSGFRANRKSTLMTDEIIRAMDDPCIVAITHPGEYIPIDMEPLAEAAAEKGVLLEINERHPLTAYDLQVAAEKGAHFLLSTDAHRASQIGHFEKSWASIEQAEIDPSLIVNTSYYAWDDPSLRIHSLKQALSES